MQPTSDVSRISNSLLHPHNLKVDSHTTLQGLWAGYGQICRLNVSPIDPSTTAAASAPSTLILKLVTPPPATTPRSPDDEGHLRKIISYQVEQHFYSRLAPRLPKDAAAVAQCLACTNTYNADEDQSRTRTRTRTIAMVLTDLRQAFPVAGEKRGTLDRAQVHAALRWLGTFHGFWWKEKATFDGARGLLRRPPLEEVRRTADGEEELGVWLNGGYTYLATRRAEYRGLADEADSEWSAVLCTPQGDGELSLAEEVAGFLAPAVKADESERIGEYETLIHGDVKSENLFSTERGDAVAFFDFQYVGLGLGVCDLAKLFTCSVPQSLLVEADVQIKSDTKLRMQVGEEQLLKQYLTTLREVSGKNYEWNTFVNHWQTALVDWLRFQASWGFWGNVEWLEARVRYIIDDKIWRDWLSEH